MSRIGSICLSPQLGFLWASEAGWGRASNGRTMHCRTYAHYVIYSAVRHVPYIRWLLLWYTNRWNTCFARKKRKWIHEYSYSLVSPINYVGSECRETFVCEKHARYSMPKKPPMWFTTRHSSRSDRRKNVAALTGKVYILVFCTSAQDWLCYTGIVHVASAVQLLCSTYDFSNEETFT